MNKNKQKLLIIDGNAIIHRSFHALPPTMRTKGGLLVNAAYGFSSFLLKAINEFQPNYIILTLDKAGPTFRHEAYTEYKATRIKAPDELYEQIPLIKDVAKAFNIPIFEKSGFEADDLIGTLCQQAKQNQNLETIIITGDMDTLQLVDKQTQVYTMSRGLSESVLYDEEKVFARYQLSPQQIIDYKALAGDPSDNIPGAKGIGAKTATNLLIDFQNIANLYKAVEKKDDRIKARILDLLITSKENVLLSQQLATIDLHAPIKLSLPEAIFNNFKIEDVIQVFSDLEFRSLVEKAKKLQDTLSPIDNTKKNEQTNKPKNSYFVVETDPDFNNFLKTLKTQKQFTIYTENTNRLDYQEKIIGIAFSFQENEAYFVITNPSRLLELKPILENNQIKKIGHNLKADWRILKNQNIILSGLDFDIMIAAYLLNPGERNYSISNLAFSELQVHNLLSNEKEKHEPQQLSLNLARYDLAAIILSANESVDTINKIKKVLEKKIISNDLKDIFSNIEMPLIEVLSTMESSGINLNKELLKNLSTKIKKNIKDLEKKIHELAGKDFNINSTKQLKEILFTDLQIPTTGLKKNKTGFSTAEDELIKICKLHPIIPFLQEYRELNKLETTYLKALPLIVDAKTKKIHTNFNQTVTATGRLSSNDPNLQNIPTRTEAGKIIRSAFTATAGYKLIGFDYSQIELRIAAHLSKDKKMIKAFQDNADIHTITASEINNVALDQVTKKMRREAKAINFGILYGQGPHGLSQGAGISYSDAKEFIKKYFSTYPGVQKMIDNFILETIKNNYAITLFGRRRPLPDINSSLPMIKKSAERMAINMPIQGTAADLIKMAMIKIFELIKEKTQDIRLLLQVHDELIFEIKEDKIDYYIVQIKKIMENSIQLLIPIIVEVAIGDNWGELK